MNIEAAVWESYEQGFITKDEVDQYFAEMNDDSQYIRDQEKKQQEKRKRDSEESEEEDSEMEVYCPKCKEECYATKVTYTLYTCYKNSCANEFLISQ